VLPFFEIAVADEPGRIRLGRSLTRSPLPVASIGRFEAPPRQWREGRSPFTREEWMRKRRRGRAPLNLTPALFASVRVSPQIRSGTKVRRGVPTTYTAPCQSQP
jgi:hypothetical protein